MFNRKQDVAPTSEISGTEAIRRRVWGRWKRGNLARTAEDLKIPLTKLEDFATSKPRGQMSAEQLQLLTKEFFYCARYDETTDRLIDTNAAATSMGKIPEPYVNPDPAVAQAQAAYKAALAATRPQETPPRAKPLPQSEQPNPFRRPGFA